MPTLRQLEYLVAVADFQHFGRAADSCHVSQPTLSPQLRALEDRLTIADLAGAQVLSLDRRHHLHRQVAAICHDLDMILLRDYEGTSLDSLHQMAASGVGLAVLPELYIRSDVGGQSGIMVLEPAGWTFTRSIAAAWRSGAAYADAYRQIADRIDLAARALLAGPGS